MLTPVRTVAPAALPVTLAEAKAHLGLSVSTYDTRLTALIQAATDHIDGWFGILGRALVTQTWRFDLPYFPSCGWPRIPLVPVQSITSVAYSDTTNTDQVFSSSNYSLQDYSGGPSIVLASGAAWPSVYSRTDAIRVTFVAGYGAASAVPEVIKLAIILLVQAKFSLMKSDVALRSETVDGVGSQTWADAGPVVSSLTQAAYSLLDPYRVRRI